MRSRRQIVRQIIEEDENPFVTGISDRLLRIGYGFPADMDTALAWKRY